MAEQGVVRSRLGVSASRGVLIMDQDGNPILNSEMTATDEPVDPDWWPEPRQSNEDYEEED